MATAQSLPQAEPITRRRIGDVLVESGVLDPDTLADALDQQRQQDQRLGRILIANRKISPEDLAEALSRQTGLGRIDLIATPPDPELMRAVDPYVCLELDAVPWRQVGATRVIAISNPELAPAAIERLGGDADRVAFALAGPEEIRRTVTDAFKGRLRYDARARCPDAFSCRGWSRLSRRRGLATLGLAVLAGVVAAPLMAFQMLMAWIVVVNTATTGLRLVALETRLRRRPEAHAPAAPRLADYRKLPRVSVLVPLLREEAVARHLLDALEAMDYPAALLDIKLVLEEDDTITRAAIDQADLPPTIEVITVPADGLKTKPRAMNYALPFCTGDIVGVYDAEDRPDPAQLRAVVAHLQDAPPDVACVQGHLDFYNTDRNWLSRCFTLEYAIWFRVILHGVERLGIPIPLGGTTVFFRRALLEEIGGWDAHNVTEDADLGMRLARFGYRCEMIESTTWEEANCRVGPWIRQRSRWLKGYAITWATHMRDPSALWRDLGPRGFLGFQVLFLGAITSYLSLPLFWLIWTAAAGFGLAFWNTFPPTLMWTFIVSMLSGQAVMLAIAVIAARDARRPGLVAWVLALPFYWPLGAVAAYRAITEVFTAPFHWHKTEHGVAVPES
jgi:cellulose synthase/poly-beta-1,6-N-acetylglucosamine synthase-like glycosyltransferase